MNERIYLLARQADELARAIEPDLREIVRYNRIRDEKFALLIIQECAKVSENRFRRMIRTLGSDMTKHFGVEE